MGNNGNDSVTKIRDNVMDIMSHLQGHLENITSFLEETFERHTDDPKILEPIIDKVVLLKANVESPLAITDIDIREILESSD